MNWCKVGSVSAPDSDVKVVLDGIRRIVRALRAFSKRTEKELGLSTAQIFVLQKIKDARSAPTVNQLAIATLTHQSSVSVVVSKLVDRKLVEKSPDEQDSRSVRLNLTKQGEYLLSKSPVSIQDRLMEAFVRLTPTERKGLARGMQALVSKAGMTEDEVLMMMEDDGSS